MQTFKVGITGGIGCGKSTVCRMMEERGIPVFYADPEAQVILNTDQAVQQKVKALLGDSVYVNGILDRKAVGAIVFGDSAKLEALNTIMRPAVRLRFEQWADSQKAPYVLMESAILIESGGHRFMDHLIVVTAPKEVRLARAMMRDGAQREQIEARMASQLDEEELIEFAHSIIVNNGTVETLRPQVAELYRYLDEVAGTH